MILKRSQKGVITLTISMAILLLSTLVVFTVAKTILLEQKITNNEIRSKQAFEAAEAGILAALNYLGTDADRDGDDVLDAFIFDPDTGSNNIGTTATTAVGSGSVTVSMTDVSGNLVAIQIVSQGFSDDLSATRTITQTSTVINPLPDYPESPVITKGGLVVGGSATVHNPEGNSTIWSGDFIDLGSNNSTATYIPDIAAGNWPECMDSSMTCGYPGCNGCLLEASNRNTASLDIVENDSSLSDLTNVEFFANFFGVTPTVYENTRVTLPVNAVDANAAADLSSYEVVWIKGDMNFSGITVGCSASVSGGNTCADADTKPSIVVVEGNASFSGNNQFFGVLYVMGNVEFIGNTTVTGAVVVEGLASNTSGSMDIWYSSEVLGKLERAGGLTGKSGAWKDF